MAHGPLRKIVDYQLLPIGTGVGRPVIGASCSHEVLECGHVMRSRKDSYGRTNAVRRRCRHCADDSPPHVEVTLERLDRQEKSA